MHGGILVSVQYGTHVWTLLLITNEWDLPPEASGITYDWTWIFYCLDDPDNPSAGFFPYSEKSPVDTFFVLPKR
jgi:hypothetical protein